MTACAGCISVSTSACSPQFPVAMKPTLQFRLSQHLTLTPQLQQSIRLLQLSTVELNQEIEKGQVACIVEAMKLMNEIESDVSGKVVKICVENGKPVEYGQTLFLVEPSA